MERDQRLAESGITDPNEGGFNKSVHGKRPNAKLKSNVNQSMKKSNSPPRKPDKGDERRPEVEGRIKGVKVAKQNAVLLITLEGGSTIF